MQNRVSTHHVLSPKWPWWQYGQNQVKCLMNKPIYQEAQVSRIYENKTHLYFSIIFWENISTEALQAIFPICRHFVNQLAIWPLIWRFFFLIFLFYFKKLNESFMWRRATIWQHESFKLLPLYSNFQTPTNQIAIHSNVWKYQKQSF